jgi:hypothetical protein
MSFFSNYYLYTHRVAYAASTAVVLLGLLAWALWQTRAEMVERQELQGELMEIVGDMNAPNGAMAMGIVSLHNNGQVKVTLPYQPPYPRVGDKVPLIMERYSDGKRLYVFNMAQWTMDGGASP